MLTNRFNLRIKLKNLTLFFMVAKTQTLEGITSLQSDGKHTPFFDLENCNLEQIKSKLIEIQNIYNLSDIFIVTDNHKTYRAWCFSHVSFDVYLHILADCLQILDYNFFYYTVKRRKATLRISRKKGRPKQRLVCVLESYPYPIPSSNDVVEKVVYDTGLEKRGVSLLIGDK
jgi:hypothetical protein